MLERHSGVAEMTACLVFFVKLTLRRIFATAQASYNLEGQIISWGIWVCFGYSHCSGYTLNTPCFIILWPHKRWPLAKAKVEKSETTWQSHIKNCLCLPSVPVLQILPDEVDCPSYMYVVRWLPIFGADEFNVWVCNRWSGHCKRWKRRWYWSPLYGSHECQKHKASSTSSEKLIFYTVQIFQSRPKSTWLKICILHINWIQLQPKGFCMLAEEGGGSAWWVSVRVQIELALVTSPPACPPQICRCNPNYICNLHIFGCSGREIPKCSLLHKCCWLLRRKKEGGTDGPILPFRCLEFSTVY